LININLRPAASVQAALAVSEKTMPSPLSRFVGATAAFVGLCEP